MDSDPLAPGVTLASANHLDSRDGCSGRSFRRGWDGWVVPGLYRSILATVLPAFNTVDLDVEGASSAILPRFRRKEEFRVRLGGAPLPDDLLVVQHDRCAGSRRRGQRCQEQRSDAGQ